MTNWVLIEAEIVRNVNDDVGFDMTCSGEMPALMSCENFSDLHFVIFLSYLINFESISNHWVFFAAPMGRCVASWP